ncbi:hypothetical protein, partial [endosymbiont of Tevnia jerichonana]|uniref:hypothetical protein n=1 Tax=endosymbiont of Tevnia jerichonana TaxID=94785 RepID=UPI0005925128
VSWGLVTAPSPCVQDHGDYKDNEDGEGGTDPVTVRFHCVTHDSNSALYAWFGYDNLNEHNVYLTLPADNEITTTATEAVVENKPTRFRPGVHDNIVRVGWVHQTSCCLVYV